MSGKALLDHLSALDDPRQSWKVVYPLPEILLVVLCGTLAGAEDFVEIARWGRQKLGFLRRLLPFARGIASHGTFNDMKTALPAELFAARFTAWVADLRERAPAIVVIDGKTSRRDRARGGDLQRPVSAWVSRQRLVLGQQAVDGKSKEINAIPLLLERLEPTGALVTIDAMGCQTGIARAIRAKGADGLLALKDNRPTLAGEARLFFDREPASAFDAHETTDGDHDRIELRRAFVSHDVDWLASDRRFPGAPRVPGLAMIGMVEAEVERAGRTTRARRDHLCPAPLTARAFAAAVRAHRGVENRLHWVMDVVFH
jgi:predicted transposase YbfD/YdcC